MVGDIDIYRAELEDSEGKERFVSESVSRNEVVFKTLAFLDESDSESFTFRLIGRPFHSDEFVDILNFTHEFGISKGALIRLLVAYTSYGGPVNNLVFDTAVTKCGNSLVIKITEQCRMMALEQGDHVTVKLTRSKTYDSPDDISRLFMRKRTEELNEFEMYVSDGCREYFERFVKDYRVIGRISLRDILFDSMDLVIDHQSAVRTEDGNVILISIPYNSVGDEGYARAFADAHDLEYDYINQYSWYHRGRTQMIIFWRKGVVLKKTS